LSLKLRYKEKLREVTKEESIESKTASFDNSEQAHRKPFITSVGKNQDLVDIHDLKESSEESFYADAGSSASAGRRNEGINRD
jgi:hypothetical protein